MTPEVQRDCAAVARELVAQPEFFAEIDELSPNTLPANSPAQRYTGDRTTADDERMLLVGALHLLQASEREIERRCGLTRRSIPAILRELEKTGRITPLKDRLEQLVGHNAEQSALLLSELLADGRDGKRSLELAAMIRSVGTVNSYHVKDYQLLTGGATERIELLVPGAGRKRTEEEWQSFMDVTSTVANAVSAHQSGPNVVEIEPSGESRHDDDTSTMLSLPASPPSIHEAGGGR